MSIDYRAIGMMSGTSLDGVDLAFCHLSGNGNTWEFEILEATTIPYQKEWKDRLAEAISYDGKRLALLDLEYGKYLGLLASGFCKDNKLVPDLVASHGHTVFHRPDLGITLQAGNGWAIASEISVPVVCDFRSLDVSLGGQGAPLVPVGDELLFPDYDYCLNLGGFSNISFSEGDKRLAFDVCPCNIMLDRLARITGADFDAGGRMASRGKIDQVLLEKLNNLPYYQMRGPRSLGIEWLAKEFLPLIDEGSNIGTQDLLRTVTEHIAMQIARVVSSRSGKMLVTGGGAHNTFLTGRIGELADVEVAIPDKQLVDFKEALVFALLGVLKLEGQINTFASVTGASRDSAGGIVCSL